MLQATALRLRGNDGGIIISFAIVCLLRHHGINFDFY